MSINFDTRDFESKINKLPSMAERQSQKAVNEIADEVLRLSSFEVPHDTGSLQNSGHVEDRGDEALVGYNKVYAARLHEHPEYSFQKGRKGKYLEDPIKNNLRIFIEFYRRIMGEIL